MKPVQISYSTPAKLLHDLALKFKPETPKKETTTWIAILFHTTANTGQITDKNNFMWIKCREAITVRTLKHQYFQRYPLEEVILKQGKRLLGDLIEVKHLRMRSPFEDDVVVLRALEQQQAELEQYHEEEEGVRKYVNKPSGTGINNVINIDDSDGEDEGGDRAGGSVTSRTSSLRGGRLPTPDTDSEGNRVAKSVTIQIDDDSDDEEDEDTAVDTMPRSAPSPQDDVVSQPTDNTPQPLTMLGVAGLMTCIDALPEPYKALALSTNDQNCEACNTDLYMREWTHFGPNHGALCTQCTMDFLRYNNDASSLAMVERMVEDDYVATGSCSQYHGFTKDVSASTPAEQHADAVAERDDDGDGDDNDDQDVFFDALQADAMETYQTGVQWNKWTEYSGSPEPAAPQDAAVIQDTTAATAAPASPEAADFDFSAFLTADADDEPVTDSAATTHVEEQRRSSVDSNSNNSTEEFSGSPEREMVDVSGGFDAHDWITQLEMHGQGDDDDDDVDAESEEERYR